MSKSRKKPSHNTQPAFVPVVLITLIGIAILALVFVPNTQELLQGILSNAAVILATVIGGIIVLYIEYNFFQRRNARGPAKRSTKPASVIDAILAWFAKRQRSSRMTVKSTSYNWSNAQRIALQSFRDKLDKFQWVEEEANIARISTDSGRAILHVVITTNAFAKPVPIERYDITINKLGDILEMKQVSL